MITIKTEHVELEQAEKIWKQQVNQVRSYIDKFWEMGRITAEVLKNARYGDSTLSKFAREVGILPINLYRYCRVYKAIPQDIKDKYSEILSFCMFEELINYGIQKKKFDEYLEKAIHEWYSVAEFGRFLSTCDGRRDPVSPRAKDAAQYDRYQYGSFYIIQLVPEALPTRVKIGYADDVDQRLNEHRTAAPTARLLKAWPCKKSWDYTAMDSITREGCKRVRNEVYEGDITGFLERAEGFFALMPKPDNEKELSGHLPLYAPEEDEEEGSHLD
ncbi:MAG TPA: hypothetical protein ACFYD6_13680 [Candidatus Brocadiia bacterium]|nr:hypothetical protein [Candidatus Brocadiales bacterium]